MQPMPPLQLVAPGLLLCHADTHLIAIDKPAGLLSVPGRGPEKADCAIARAQALWPDALVVHRLDMATSGLLIFARGIAAQRQLSLAFEKREVEKIYVAELAGLLAEDAGEVALPMMPDWPNRPLQKIDLQYGKPALTRWRVLARGDSTTRVALHPLTGRSHQLRLHMQALGHPILGDALYAPPEAAASRPRLQLHAWRLTLAHPASGELLTLEAPVPF